MNWITAFRDRLGVKIFISYLVIIIIGAVVLIGTAEVQAPAALNRHIERMREIVGEDPELVEDLMVNYLSATAEILAVATGVAVIAALAVSFFTTRRIIRPIEHMLQASQDIAVGDYHRRVPVVSSDELGRMAAAFNSMAATLERTEERRLALIGDVAHELRTPLGGIKGTMEGLIDGVLPAEAETFINVQREVYRLQRLVQDLEELSRAEAGQIVLKRQSVDAALLVRNVIEKLAPQYADKGVSLSLDLPLNHPGVHVDPERVTQILVNLLGNALQYTPSGGEVRVSSASGEGEWITEVVDTGIGIAGHDLPHIFERFYRVDKSRSRPGGGSGVGLTIARHLAQAHGGSITASSPGLGHGSTFTLSLPIEQ